MVGKRRSCCLLSSSAQIEPGSLRARQNSGNRLSKWRSDWAAGCGLLALEDTGGLGRNHRLPAGRRSSQQAANAPAAPNRTPIAASGPLPKKTLNRISATLLAIVRLQPNQYQNSFFMAIESLYYVLRSSRTPSRRSGHLPAQRRRVTSRAWSGTRLPPPGNTVADLQQPLTS